MSVKKTLTLSLNQDVISLNELIEEISRTSKEVTIKSQLFSYESTNLVSRSSTLQSARETSYERILEIVLDRVYTLINCFLQYLTNTTPVSNHTFVRQPTKITLGLSLKLLWNIIMETANNKTTNKTTMDCGNHNYSIIAHKHTQTDIVTLNVCDSCSSAIFCMKKLLKCFEQQQDRIIIKYKIFDITQFGAMLEVANSIEEALCKLYDKLNAVNSENHLLKTDNENMKSKLEKKIKIVDFLQEEVNVLRGKLEKETCDVLRLREIHTKLTEAKTIETNKLTELQISFKSLNLHLQAALKENQILQTENDRLQSNLKESITILTKYHQILTNNLFHVDQQHNIIKSIISQYETSIMLVNTRFTKLTKCLGKIEIKLKNNFDHMNEIFQLSSNYGTFCVKIKDVFKEKINDFKENNDKNAIEVVNVRGNPAEDISRQIEVNKDKIRDLETENIRLGKLLDRFKFVRKVN